MNRAALAKIGCNQTGVGAPIVAQLGCLTKHECKIPQHVDDTTPIIVCCVFSFLIDCAVNECWEQPAEEAQRIAINIAKVQIRQRHIGVIQDAPGPKKAS
jgi:hypothetical protein